MRSERAWVSVPEEQIAEAFVAARRHGRALSDYPGPFPETEEAAYRLQDAAIDRWPTAIIGWKVGRVGNGENGQPSRLSGPVFAPYLRHGEGPFAVPVIANGFAAIEGECVIVLGADAPAGKTSFTLEEAQGLVGSVHMGAEIASSPYPGINDHGPFVTISDFGNNLGLALGPALPGWPNVDPGDFTFEVSVNGAAVGTSRVSRAGGGIFEALRFLAENTARRGRPLRRGMAILTGAVTGVHPVHVGDSARVHVAGVGSIDLVFGALGDADLAA